MGVNRLQHSFFFALFTSIFLSAQSLSAQTRIVHTIADARGKVQEVHSLYIYRSITYVSGGKTVYGEERHSTNRVMYTYNDAGQLSAERSDKQTSYPHMQLCYPTDWSSYTSEYRYEGNALVSEVTSTPVNKWGNHSYTHFYKNGLRIKTISSSQNDPLVIKHFAYDSLGRLFRETWIPGSDTTKIRMQSDYSYLTERIECTDYAGDSLRKFAVTLYDPEMRKLQYRHYNPDGAESDRMRYIYNKNGDLLRVIHFRSGWKKEVITEKHVYKNGQKYKTTEYHHATETGEKLAHKDITRYKYTTLK